MQNLFFHLAWLTLCIGELHVTENSEVIWSSKYLIVLICIEYIIKALIENTYTTINKVYNDKILVTLDVVTITPSLNEPSWSGDNQV